MSLGTSYSQQNSTPDHTPTGNALTVSIPGSENHTPSPSQVVVMDCPPHVLMCNESEGDPWMINITLMYAQETPYQPGPYGKIGLPTPQKPVVKKNEPQKERTNEKSLRELLEEQDIDLTHGWWGISDAPTMDKLLRSFCLRGYREKSLFKAIQKNKETFYRMFDPSNLGECKEEFQNLLSRLSVSNKAIAGRADGAEKAKGRSVQGSEGVTHKVDGAENDDMDTSDGKDKPADVSGESAPCGESSQEQNTADKAENADKSDSDDSSDSDSSSSSSSSDSSESGGAKPRLSTSSRSSNLILRSHLAVSLKSAHEIPLAGVFDPEFLELVDQFALKVLEYVEGMEDRLFVAQLHEENCKQWEKLSSRVQELDMEEPLLPMISERLLHLEVITCRKYLKPPLRDKKLYAEETPRAAPKSGRGGRGRDRSSHVSRYEAPPIELPSEGLSKWRAAVERATSASQLAVCASQLEKCVTWEKSSSVVFCQVCHSGENESLLLLCDGCDRGTHTYCCKPELSGIPAGDWYCRECLVNKSKIKPCYVCDSTRGVLLSCIICPKTFHKRCLNPPLKRVPTPPWKCPYCKHKSIPKNRAPKANSAHGGGRKRQPKDDESLCKLILNLLKEHDDAWPFLEPVGKKQFPEYYKVIKKPMDLQTMRAKLEDGKYNGNKDVFAADARQMFINCSYYNEDNSEIGISGHSLKAFFEKKWAMYNTDTKN